jgi:hypothetical protein
MNLVYRREEANVVTSRLSKKTSFDAPLAAPARTLAQEPSRYPHKLHDLNATVSNYWFSAMRREAVVSDPGPGDWF